jgi:hypothetical protein
MGNFVGMLQGGRARASTPLGIAGRGGRGRFFGGCCHNVSSVSGLDRQLRHLFNHVSQLSPKASATQDQQGLWGLEKFRDADGFTAEQVADFPE